MNWLADFLQPTTATIIWAYMLYRLGLFAVGKFESAIGKAVDRLRKFGSAEFDPSPQQPGSDEGLLLTANTPPAELPPPNSLVGRFETSIREWLQKVPPAEHEAQLVRSLSGWQIGWHFETVNFSILGSQLAVLQAVNTQALNLTQVRGFYDQSARTFPDYYRNYAFEPWLAWLADAAKGVSVEGDVVSITEDGREFLKYIIGRGYSLTRFG
ncbi:hypothetical protein [Thiobacillus sedimenti]|uniref:Uncharacterized protein n=1 Tax=Thiobacillus sedimenti TaxID=3110231 RepID=A0ABZ1CEZ8_9PROT|nr:hypothetical protein [Thiobacillus sp. SCUT-2]WRS37952.1 hypothetical protein VA613_07940 [Thiobacillus sp. SCUT-2]